MSIAQRRHHAERMKRKLRRKEKAAPYWTSDGEPDKRAAGLYANHGCNCSCWMCGNPRRKQGKKTIQELKADQDYENEATQCWPSGAHK